MRNLQARCTECDYDGEAGIDSCVVLDVFVLICARCGAPLSVRAYTAAQVHRLKGGTAEHAYVGPDPRD